MSLFSVVFHWAGRELEPDWSNTTAVPVGHKSFSKKKKKILTMIGRQNSCLQENHYIYFYLLLIVKSFILLKHHLAQIMNDRGPSARLWLLCKYNIIIKYHISVNDSGLVRHSTVDCVWFVCVVSFVNNSQLDLSSFYRWNEHLRRRISNIFLFLLKRGHHVSK